MTKKPHVIYGFYTKIKQLQTEAAMSIEDFIITVYYLVEKIEKVLEQFRDVPFSAR